MSLFSLVSLGNAANSIHLTDHWLSFFMNENLPTFRSVLEKALGLTWSSADIERIVVTEYEQRGFGGRGSFIDWICSLVTLPGTASVPRQDALLGLKVMLSQVIFTVLWCYVV